MRHRIPPLQNINCVRTYARLMGSDFRRRIQSGNTFWFGPYLVRVVRASRSAWRSCVDTCRISVGPRWAKVWLLFPFLRNLSQCDANIDHSPKYRNVRTYVIQCTQTCMVLHASILMCGAHPKIKQMQDKVVDSALIQSHPQNIAHIKLMLNGKRLWNSDPRR